MRSPTAKGYGRVDSRDSAHEIHNFDIDESSTSDVQRPRKGNARGLSTHARSKHDDHFQRHNLQHQRQQSRQDYSNTPQQHQDPQNYNGHHPIQVEVTQSGSRNYRKRQSFGHPTPVLETGDSFDSQNSNNTISPRNQSSSRTTILVFLAFVGFAIIHAIARGFENMHEAKTKQQQQNSNGIGGIGSDGDFNGNIQQLTVGSDGKEGYHAFIDDSDDAEAFSNASNLPNNQLAYDNRSINADSAPLGSIGSETAETPTSSATILSRTSQLSSLISNLDASDMVECYVVTRMAPLSNVISSFPISGSSTGGGTRGESNGSDNGNRNARILLDNDADSTGKAEGFTTASSPTTSTSNIPSGTIQIRKSALAFRYRPRVASATHNSHPSVGSSPSNTGENSLPREQNEQQKYFELTLEYGPQRTGATKTSEAMPMVHLDTELMDMANNGEWNTNVDGYNIGKYVSWENEARIYHSTHISTEWTEAYYMAPLTGVVMEKIIQRAVDYPNKRPRYQPFEVVSIPSGNLILRSSGSDDFVWSMFRDLADLYVDIDPILVPPRGKVQLFVADPVNYDKEEENGEGAGEDNSGNHASISNQSKRREPNPNVQRVKGPVEVTRAAMFYENFFNCANAIKSGDYSLYLPRPTPGPTTSPTPNVTAVPSSAPTLLLKDTLDSDTESEVVNKKSEGKTIDPVNNDEDSKYTQTTLPKTTNTEAEEEDEYVYKNNNVTNTTVVTYANEESELNSTTESEESSMSKSAADYVSHDDETGLNNGIDTEHNITTKNDHGNYTQPQKPGTWKNSTLDGDYVGDSDEDDKGDRFRTRRIRVLVSQKKISRCLQDGLNTTSNATLDTEAVSDDESFIDEWDNDDDLEYADMNADESEDVGDAAEAAEKAAIAAAEAAETAAAVAATNSSQADSAAAASEAAKAAKKAADATVAARAKTAAEGLLSGDGVLMTSVLSTCFSDPKYGIRKQEFVVKSTEVKAADDDDIATGDDDDGGQNVIETIDTTYAYIYLDGDVFFRLNLTAPYWSTETVLQTVPPPHVPPEGKGDAVDWAIFIFILTGTLFGFMVILHQVGFVIDKRLRFRWFFKPTNYNHDPRGKDCQDDYSDDDDDGMYQLKRGEGFPHSIGIDAIPTSMGGKLPHYVSSGANVAPFEAATKHSSRETMDETLEKGNVDLELAPFTPIEPSIKQETEHSSLPASLRIKRDTPDDVERPSLKSTSKIALPQMSPKYNDGRGTQLAYSKFNDNSVPPPYYSIPED